MKKILKGFDSWKCLYRVPSFPSFGTENIGPNWFKYLVCHKFGRGKKCSNYQICSKIIRISSFKYDQTHFLGIETQFPPISQFLVILLGTNIYEFPVFLMCKIHFSSTRNSLKWNSSEMLVD